MKQYLLFFCFCILSIHSAYSYQEERILQFHSDIRIEASGRVEVSEYISVYATGDEIKRGIVRRIPLNRKEDPSKGGKSRRINIDVLEVTRDEQSESFHTKEEGGHIVVYVGNKDVILSKGTYQYKIRYASYGHIGFFDNFDELYWNVTGNEWSFLIEQASVSIHLPEGAQALRGSCYTGTYGSSASSCREIESKDPSTASYATETSLHPGEGFTVAVAFPRDIIDRSVAATYPGEVSLLWKIVYALIGLSIAALYFYYTWKKVGKDPEKPVVIPQFRPPHNWSPAIVRYLYKRKYDNRTFTSAILSLAVKKALNIQQEKKKYKLIKNQGTLKKELSPEEKTVFNTLLKDRKTLPVSDSNHARFSRASSRLKDSLSKQQNLKDYFRKNGEYIAKAAGLVLLLLSAFLILVGLKIQDVLFMIPFLAVSALIISFIPKAKGCIILFILIWGVGFLFGSLLMIFNLLDKDFVSLTYAALLLVGFFLYLYLIKAPTELGAKTQAELEGFRLYLCTAEGDRLNALTPPERTPELFEELLPYAVALNVENEWSSQFNSILEQAGYQPEWYDNSKPLAYGVLASSLGNSLTSSLGSAQVDPTSSSSSSSSGSGSWSSGSSGGGSSGGGGGGGGGGGW